MSPLLLSYADSDFSHPRRPWRMPVRLRRTSSQRPRRVRDRSRLHQGAARGIPYRQGTPGLPRGSPPPPVRRPRKRENPGTAGRPSDLVAQGIRGSRVRAAMANDGGRVAARRRLYPGRVELSRRGTAGREHDERAPSPVVLRRGHQEPLVGHRDSRGPRGSGRVGRDASGVIRERGPGPCG